MDSQEAPICIRGYQGSFHFWWRNNGSRKQSVNVPTLSRPPNPIVRIALPLVSYELIAGLHSLTPFYPTGSSKEEGCPPRTMVTRKKQNEESQDHAYPNLSQKRRYLRPYKIGPGLQGKPTPYAV